MDDLRRLRVTVPATIDGLGAGYGIVGLALALEDTVEVELTGSPGEVSGDESLCRAYRAWPAETLPGAMFTLQKGIPEGFGLGEQTARMVAGLTAAAAALQEKDARTVLFSRVLEAGASPAQLGTCVMGGLTTALRRGETLNALHVADHLAMDIVLFLPREPFPGALGPADPARLAYLLTALVWGRWDWLEAARSPSPDDTDVERLRVLARESGAYLAETSPGALVALAPLGGGEAISGALEDGARKARIAGRTLVTGVRESGVTVERLENG